VHRVVLSTALPPTQTALQPNISVIDVASFSLPVFNESKIPSQVTDPADYDHEHTRRWSAEIAGYDAFIFVTPQYNWGIPGGLKNAIDYLDNEWKGKPVMVVSYGGHGGGKAGRHLREVCQGLRMRVVEQVVELGFKGRENLVKAAGGKDLGLEGNNGGIWGSAEKEAIGKAYVELLELVAVPIVVEQRRGGKD
jgi:NAD(P)H-dependent FMN reductase